MVVPGISTKNGLASALVHLNRTMKLDKKIINMVAVILLYAPLAFAEEYPANSVARPLTLPAGLLQIGGGIRSVPSTDLLSNSYLNVAYGLTDRLELDYLGISYDLIGIPESRNEAAIKVRLVGFGNSSVIGTTYETETSLEGKWVLRPDDKAFVYRIMNNHVFHSNSNPYIDSDKTALSLGVLMSPAEHFNVEFYGKYISTSGVENLDTLQIEPMQAYIGEMKVGFVSSRFDILFDAGLSDISGIFRRRVSLGVSLAWRL